MRSSIEDFAPSPHYWSGLYALKVLRRMPPAPDNARGFHDAVDAALQGAGFKVWREIAVPVRDSGRGLGFIDLLADFRGGCVALELDRRSPRPGSMDKLRMFDAFRIIVLRGAEPWSKERDIDAIISLPVLA